MNLLTPDAELTGPEWLRRFCNTRMKYAGDDKKTLLAIAQELQDTADTLDEATAINEKLGALLTRIADAVKGPPAPNTAHGWHDLPELVAALVEAHGLPKPGEIPNEGVH